MSRLAPVPALVVVLIALVASGCRDRDESAVHVYAAASLTDVMEALADTFRVLPQGGEIVLNVAGSSLLARQIEAGAPADLFVSAHPDWTDYLYRKHRIRPPVRLPVSNRLVEIRRRGATRSDARIAVADPDHVPAGMYAREALLCEGRWEAMSTHVIPTLDVRAAVTSVLTGAAGTALVYASDALLAPDLEVRDVVSDRCQPDIRYTAGVVEGSRRGDSAVRFLDLMRDPSVAPLWRRHGFIHHSTHHEQP